ncbi:MAG: class I SAM-dependent methyltransferase [Hyphomonas sp.]
MARQGVRSAWYGLQMRRVKSASGGWNVEGEEAFVPSSGKPDMSILRKAYFELFKKDRQNIEAGLYRSPQEVSLTKLPEALRSARAFFADAEAVNRRRTERVGDEVKQIVPQGSNRYPDYYLQNFHYQSDGWFSDESAELYDTQVEALFSGTAAAMRRCALAAIAREMKGRDQREQNLLDVACGNGRFLETVMDHYPRLQATGLDLSPNYTDAARKRLSAWPQVAVLHEAAEAMPVEAGSQNIVVSVFLFHELPEEVRAKVLAEVARVLVPGGLFVLCDSVQFDDYDGLNGALEYFPHGFHEPYYLNYLSWDHVSACEAVGLTPVSSELAFLSKVSCWRKPG